MKKVLELLIIKLIKKIIDKVENYKYQQLKDEFRIDKSVILGKNCSLIGNINIGKHTYLNDGSTISSGNKSKVSIGKHCAIGRYVHITSKTHSFERPTSDENYINHEHYEKDTTIGHYVWIGDHVFIKQGIKVGNYAIIGANSVVTKDVKDFEIVAGLPAKHLRFNTQHYKYDEHLKQKVIK